MPSLIYSGGINYPTASMTCGTDLPKMVQYASLVKVGIVLDSRGAYFKPKDVFDAIKHHGEKTGVQSIHRC